MSKTEICLWFASKWYEVSLVHVEKDSLSVDRLIFFMGRLELIMFAINVRFSTYVGQCVYGWFFRLFSLHFCFVMGILALCCLFLNYKHISLVILSYF